MLVISIVYLTLACMAFKALKGPPPPPLVPA